MTQCRNYAIRITNSAQTSNFPSQTYQWSQLMVANGISMLLTSIDTESANALEDSCETEEVCHYASTKCI